MIIAVDFDGTIVEHAYPKIGKERPFATATLRQLQKDGHTVGVLASDEVCTSLEGLVPDALRKSYGPQGDLPAIAAHIYEALIAFDDTEADALLGEGTTETGLGLAIMNRLHKASGFHTIEI